MAAKRGGKRSSLVTPADGGVLPEFREALRRAQFNVAAITELHGEASVTALNSRSPRLLRKMQLQASPLGTLVRLFVLGLDVAVDEAAAAIEPVPVEALAKLGMLRVEKSRAVPLIGIQPHDDLAIACDLAVEDGRKRDYVPGLFDSSVMLELFTIRQPFGRALDMGTGNGVQALRAGLHCDEVTAVDANVRALEFGKFNAALNGISNIQFLGGNGFEPVENRTFDLIVGNLPFVITPSVRFLFRDSGMQLDGFARRITVEAPEHLNEGGYCQLLCQWVEKEGEAWEDRLGSWFDASGCDVWVMKTESLPVDAYAEKWITDTEPKPLDRMSKLFEEWMAYYAKAGITAIHSGAIAMRRRTGKNWIRIDEGPGRARSPFGGAVLRAFALGDFMQTLDDAALLDARLHVSPDIHMLQRCEWSNGEWRVEACQLRFHNELEYMANVDEYVAKLVGRCSGERPVGDLIGDLALETGISAEQLRPACLQLIRGLLQRGFLQPEPAGGVQ